MASVQANRVQSSDVAITEAGNPSADEIRAALARLLRQPALTRSRQLSAFLSYIVETTLAGRAASIKSYSIACDALRREADFDPQNDPIVRVEAGRLRRILVSYYSAAGAQDPVRIDIPLGRYVPLFSYNRPVTPPTATNSPRNALTKIIGIAGAFGATTAMLFSGIGLTERMTLIAALLMGLHMLAGGGWLSHDAEAASVIHRDPVGNRADDNGKSLALASARRISAAGDGAGRSKAA